MHSMKSINDKEPNTVKGVNIATEFNECKDTLCNEKVVRNKKKRVQSEKHIIGTCEVNKISLSCFDDKKFVSDGIPTLAYFHKTCKKQKDVLKDDLFERRFSQMIINKKRLSQIRRTQNDSYQKEEIFTDDH